MAVEIWEVSLHRSMTYVAMHRNLEPVCLQPWKSRLYIHKFFIEMRLLSGGDHLACDLLA
jgi:hypothetical protein